MPTSSLYKKICALLCLSAFLILSPLANIYASANVNTLPTYPVGEISTTYVHNNITSNYTGVKVEIIASTGQTVTYALTEETIVKMQDPTTFRLTSDYVFERIDTYTSGNIPGYTCTVTYEFGDLTKHSPPEFKAYFKYVPVVFKASFYLDSTLIQEIECEYGLLTAFPAMPTKEGYTFKGWRINGVTLDTIYTSFADVPKLTRDTSFNAVWEEAAEPPINMEIEVTCLNNNVKVLLETEEVLFTETNADGLPQRYRAFLIKDYKRALAPEVFGLQSTELSYYEISSVTNYLFHARFNTYACVVVDLGVNVSPPNSTITYLNIRPKVLNVTFLSDGQLKEEKKVSYDEVFSLPHLAKEGYILKGWVDESGATYTGQGIRQDTILTAVWDEILLTVDFMVDGNIHAQITVPWGTTLIDALKKQQDLRFKSVSLSSVTNSSGDYLLIQDAVIVSEKPTTTDSVITKTKKYWYVPLIAIGGLALLLCLIPKRRRKRGY